MTLRALPLCLALAAAGPAFASGTTAAQDGEVRYTCRLDTFCSKLGCKPIAEDRRNEHVLSHVPGSGKGRLDHRGQVFEMTVNEVPFMLNFLDVSKVAVRVFSIDTEELLMSVVRGDPRMPTLHSGRCVKEADL